MRALGQGELLPPSHPDPLRLREGEPSAVGHGHVQTVLPAKVTP